MPTYIDAERRARELLFRVLSPEEQVGYNRTGRIEVTGSEGGKYRIHLYGYVGNIEPLQRVKLGTLFKTYAEVGSTLCAHPRMDTGLPMSDAFVAQILAIKTDVPPIVTPEF
jgi:hypothetical protein